MHHSADIAIIGAGIAGASLAAFLADRARVLLLEAEDQPGYHATGRSAAFWSESYGGPEVQPLTTASGPWLAEAGMLSPRGCVHIATRGAQLAPLVEQLDRGGVAWREVEREALMARIPGLHPRYAHAVEEPTCQDIDAARLHASFLARVRQTGGTLLCGARVTGMERRHGRWHLAARDDTVDAGIVVNAAGAWASSLATLAGAAPIPIQPMRRTIVQLATDPPPPPDLPLVMDAAGHFYFKAEAAGRLWLSPHDETPVDAHDVAPEELDQAIAIDRLRQVVDWRVVRRERAWAGLRSFTADRLPVYGFDPVAPDFFWCAGQGGFGIQTAPAAGMLAAALLLRETPPAAVRHIDPGRYRPDRFVQAG